MFNLKRFFFLKRPSHYLPENKALFLREAYRRLPFYQARPQDRELSTPSTFPSPICEQEQII